MNFDMFLVIQLKHTKWTSVRSRNAEQNVSVDVVVVPSLLMAVDATDAIAADDDIHIT